MELEIYLWEEKQETKNSKAIVVSSPTFFESDRESSISENWSRREIKVVDVSVVTSFEKEREWEKESTKKLGEDGWRIRELAKFMKITDGRESLRSE